MFETKRESATANFFLGFGARIGAGLAMFVLTFLLGSMLERVGRATFFDTFQGFALVWGISSAALFAYVGFSSLKKRPSVFRAGLVTAFAVVALLDAACWNLHLG